MTPFRRLAACAFTLIALCSTAAHAQSAGERAVRAIYDRWHGKTYTTMTFVQETQFPNGRSEWWYESMRVPGNLRIDIQPGDSTARLMLVRNDSIYQGRVGRPVGGRAFVHPLMVLFTDIAIVEPSVTVAKLVGLGYDLSKTRDDVFMGKAVTVIGAGAGDSTSTQFWIEKERLLVVRLIDKERQPGAGVGDTRVLKHVPAGKGWVESDIAFYQGGKLMQRELYNDITVDPPLDDRIFQPVFAPLPSWIANAKRR